MALGYCQSQHERHETRLEPSEIAKISAVGKIADDDLPGSSIGIGNQGQFGLQSSIRMGTMRSATVSLSDKGWEGDLRPGL